MNAKKSLPPRDLSGTFGRSAGLRALRRVPDPADTENEHEAGPGLPGTAETEADPAAEVSAAAAPGRTAAREADEAPAPAGHAKPERSRPARAAKPAEESARAAASQTVAAEPVGRAASDSAATASSGQYSFRLREDVLRRLGVYCRTHDRTIGDVVLDAVEELYPRLEELVAPLRPQTRSGPLFSRREAAPRARAMIQTAARLTSSQAKVIDDLVVEVGAKSRTQLLDVVLDEYLPAG